MKKIAIRVSVMVLLCIGWLCVMYSTVAWEFVVINGLITGLLHCWFIFMKRMSANPVRVRMMSLWITAKKPTDTNLGTIEPTTHLLLRHPGATDVVKTRRMSLHLWFCPRKRAKKTKTSISHRPPDHPLHRNALLPRLLLV